MNHLFTAIRNSFCLLSILILSASCARKEVAFAPYEIQYMATVRCLSKLNVWPRDVIEAMTQMKIEASSSDEWLGMKDIMKNGPGISKSVKEQVEGHPFMEDCVNTTLTHFATDFPTERAAGFIMALKLESNWFEDGEFEPEPLKTNFYELCRGELKDICGAKPFYKD